MLAQDSKRHAYHATNLYHPIVPVYHTLFRGYGEKLRLHVDFREPSQAARELEQSLDTFEDLHVGKADFLDTSISISKRKMQRGGHIPL